MRTDELDFDLPPELIAQTPATRRDESRLMHHVGATGATEHRLFSDLPGLLRPGDLLVLNNARVIPARFMLRKPTGGAVEGLFLHAITPSVWRVMLKNLGRRHDIPLSFADELALTTSILHDHGGGEYDLHVHSDESAQSILQRLGRIPLPPYIHRQRGHDPRDLADAERYQTVYAAVAGSVAAPTAGLHFTPQLFEQLAARGVERAFVTLHVGAGTFKPVTATTLEEHPMHHESYEISQAAADALNRAKQEGRRIVAVGTTAARVLESQPAGASFSSISTTTNLFIRPPYAWKHVGALLTNFHLPRSTLIALVAARVGLTTQRALYQLAIQQRYRFFSYGDAMFLE